jgi:multicomponent Na+:H+ antiporter subunit G
MNSAATAIKIAVIALLIITVNPIGAHAIAKGAYRAGIRPEKRMETDDYGRDLEDE